MSFWNRNIGHMFKEIYSRNPLLNSNFIFLKLDDDVESSQAALERELDALEARLETEMDLKERAKIQKEMRNIEDQMDRLETVSAPLNTLLLNGLQNNIDEIDFFIENEPDIKKREELEANRLNCINALEARQTPVTSITELNEAVDQIESDQRLINSLSNRKVDEVDLQLFLNSGLLPFVDSRFEGAINIAFEQMLTNDNVQAALGKRQGDLFEKADTAWMEYKSGVEQGIKDLEQEKDQINSQITGASTSERERLRRRLTQIESDIKHSQTQISEARSSWTHRERTRQELSSASASVLDSVKPETLDKLQQLLTEAQGIRAERVQDYLAAEFGKLEEQLADIKHRDVFSKEILESLEAELAEARGIIADQRISDPKVLRRLADNFQSATLALSTSAEEVREAKENRPQIEEQVRSDYARFKSVIEGFTPERVKELKEKCLAQLKEGDFPENEKIFKKNLIALDILAGEDVTMTIEEEGEEKEIQMSAVIAEFEARLENISEMSPEELILLSQDLEVFKRKLEYLENLDANLSEAFSLENQDAKLAHKTIRELERAQNPDDIRAILETNLGAEHLEFVSHGEFEKDYRQFTKTGHMVFQEEGNKWRIIIDESVFEEEKSLEILKKQLTHELLHLEFEKSDRVKAQVRKALIESDPEKWQQIREAFIEMAKEKNKKPPHGEEWEDDDILSELYAMQNEMGRTWSEGKSSTDKLNNLLTGAGVAAAISDIAEKTRGYEEGAKIKTHGYGEGVEEGEKAPAVSRSISDMESLTKEAAVFHGNREKINDIRNRLKEIRKSDFLSMVSGAEELVDAMEAYNEATNELNDDFEKDPDSQVFAVEIKNRIDKVAGDLTDVEDKVGKAARKAPNKEIGLLRKLWINTTFLSMEDFVQMGTDAYEFFQRRHKRKVADHAAKLGMALFSGTDLGREARARQQKAEAEEVNEWKSRYETLDAWQLMDELKGIANGIAPNRDQLKAILKILADKGRIDWYNQDLWTALNKLQTKVELKPGDQLLLHNSVLLRQRLRTALGEIYDYDEFENLERTNEGSYQSEKGKYDTRHSRMQDKLTDQLDEMLIQHKTGEQVDPILYESIMEYCIKNGKSYAENIMFHLISGMAAGLLAPDRGLALGDHLNVWPAVDWFSSMSPPMSQVDWKSLCMRYFPNDFMKASITAEGFGNEFKNFYWTTIQNNSKVIERVKKSVSERGWDHDWGRSIACLGDADTAKRFLSGRSGQQETKVTGVSNAYTGAVQWLEENARNPQYANKENFARMAGWIAMSEGILDGTAYNRGENDINTRSNEAMNQALPREAIFGNHGDLNTGQHREITQQFLFMIDANFFTMLSGREARSDEQKKELGIQARDYLLQAYPSLTQDLADVEVIDQIYNNLDLIIGTMFNKMSEAEFKSILATIVANI